MSHSESRAKLPVGWKWKLLGEIANTSSGGTPKRSNSQYFTNGTIPWLKIGDLNDSLIRKTEEQITQLGLKESSAELLPPGTLLVAMYGSIGKLGILAAEAATNQAICAIQPDEKIVSRDYMFWFLRAQRPLLANAGYGGVQSNISQTFLKKLPIPLPPPGEQNAIVRRLERKFQSITLADQYVSRAEQLLKLLRDGMMDRVVNAGPKKKTLGKCLAEPMKNGRSVPTANTGFPVLRLTALKDGIIDLFESKIGDWTPSDAHPYLVKNDDFLIARGNGSLRLVGRGGLVRDVPTSVAFPDTLIRVRTDRDQLRSEYLRLVWNSRYVRRQIERVARTTAGIYKINQSDLAALEIPVPSVKEQDAVVAEVQPQLQVLGDLEGDVRALRTKGERLRRSALLWAFPKVDIH